MKVYEASNPNDPDELTNERDILWLCRALRGDFGPYAFHGPYTEDAPDECFVVMVKGKQPTTR